MAITRSQIARQMYDEGGITKQNLANLGLAAFNKLNTLQNEFYKPRIGTIGLSDVVGILADNPYSMAATGIAAALNPQMFGEDRQLTGGIDSLGQGLGVVVDESGRSYTADELNALNALGGYYTDPARSSRRRAARIQKMLQRREEGKRISQKSLENLLEQQRQEEEARQEAARQIQDFNRVNQRGGYQSDFGSDSDFMEGPKDGSDLTSTMGST